MVTKCDAVGPAAPSGSALTSAFSEVAKEAVVAIDEKAVVFGSGAER